MTNLANEDGSPVFKIYEQTRLYNFFLFTLTATDILIFEKSFQRVVSRHHFKSDQDFEDFIELQSRFHSLTDSMLLSKPDDEQNSFSELSLNEILYLLSSIDSVAKYLLDLDDSRNSRNLIAEVGVTSGTGPDWQKSFFTEAQFVFEEMKEIFKDFPEIIELINNSMGGEPSRKKTS